MWREMDFLLNEYPETSHRSSPGLMPRFRRTWQMAFVCAVALLCAVGAYLWTSIQPHAPESALHSTNIGVQKSERLSDGSVAHLNTNSLIETEYLASVRIVRLIRGEALFEVVHDPRRPFIVYAGESQIRAIGTRFVVRMDSDNIVVMVTDGQVQLSKRTAESRTSEAGAGAAKSEVILISQGEGVEIDSKSQTPQISEIERDDLDRRLSWLDGRLVFDNERLETVVAEVNRYVPGQILIDDPGLRDVRVSGRFEIRNTEALLEAIEVSFNVRVSHEDDRVIRLKR